MNTTDAETPRATWAQVTYFQVYKEFAGPSPETALIFANGRQQAKIIVAFTANDANGNPVSLTDADIAEHVRLIHYETGKPIEKEPGTWTSSRTKNDYLWDEGILFAAIDADAERPVHVAPRAGVHVQSVEFFLSTTATSSSMIGAKVSFPGGGPDATTNHRDVEFNKPGGDGAGQFNSSVIGKPVALSSVPVEYGDTANGLLIPTYVGSTDYFYRAIEHLVTVRIRGLVVPLREVTSKSSTEKVPSIYKYGSNFDTYQWGLTYYGQPGKTEADFPMTLPDRIVTFDRNHGRTRKSGEIRGTTGLAYRAIDAIENITLTALGQEIHADTTSLASKQAPPEVASKHTPEDMYNKCIGKIQSSGMNQFVVGLIVGNLGAQFQDSNGEELPENTQTNLTILDAYGNDHALTLAFKGSRATDLSISRAARDSTVDPPVDPPADPWKITQAQIVVDHPQVYANGRQQARIHINIRATLDGITKPLSEKEKASIRLIRYDEQDEVIPWKDAEEFEDWSAAEGWSAQASYRGYDFHASSGEHMPNNESQAGDLFDFYVSAGADQVGIRRMIGFSIEGDNGSLYRSTGYCRTSTGKAEYFSHMDLGDLHTVTAMRTPVYTPSDIQLNGVRPLNPIDQQEVSLSIFHLGRPVSIRRIACEPEGMINWRANAGSSPCFTGYANPGERAYHWNEVVPTGRLPKPTPANPLTHSVFILCARNDIPREDHIDPPTGPLTVHVMDGAGNVHTCRIGFTPGARDELTIS